MASIRRRVNVCGEISCSVAEALLDTGADRTLVPARMARDLGLRFTGKRIGLRSASGQEIQTDEAIAHIGIGQTGCAADVPVTVPRDSTFKELIIGNDFMAMTGMVLGYTKPRIISCPSERVSTRARCGCEENLTPIGKDRRGAGRAANAFGPSAS